VIRRLAASWGVSMEAVAVEMATIGVSVSAKRYEVMDAEERATLADACLALQKELALDIVTGLRTEEGYLALLEYVDPEEAAGVTEMLILQAAVDSFARRVA